MNRHEQASDGYRGLPSVDRVLSDPRLRQATAELGTGAVTLAVRDELAGRRRAIPKGNGPAPLDEIVAAAAARAYSSLRPALRPVINATGVIIHTNLGRVPLSDATVSAMADVSRGYSNLEYDLEAGSRGSRHHYVDGLVRRLTGAEAAMAVNNNAAALLLGLSALASDREVVISRGQLVEIGGGFRIPDVMAQSGARLREVGTTNRTYIGDYEAALTESTAAVMRVHSSNYRIIGFTSTPELSELVQLAHAHGLALLEDLGSGCLLDTRPYGLAAEPTPQDSIRAGADLVFFSGDKLLGGPQAGIIAGREELIARLLRHPLARALRLDKTSIAGLIATLTHYVKGEAEQEVPVWRMISAGVEEIDQRCRSWMQGLPGAEVIDSRSMIGGGSLPEESLPTRALAIQHTDLEGLARTLRSMDPPIVGRIADDRFLLDPRTVQASEDAFVSTALQAALNRS